MTAVATVGAETVHGTIVWTTRITLATRIDALEETTATEPARPLPGENDATAREIAGTATTDGTVVNTTSAATGATTEGTEGAIAIETTIGVVGTTETRPGQDTKTKTRPSPAEKATAGAKAARPAGPILRNATQTCPHAQNSRQTGATRPCPSE